MDNRSWESIPADAFIEILQRLPPSPRQRLRLVCRHWLRIIDDRTPATQARAMVLGFVTRTGLEDPLALVFDDLTEAQTKGGRYLTLRGAANNPGSIAVGSCNGLLCLHRTRGDVVVVNPFTSEKLAVPPPPIDVGVAEAATFSFGYHPATGLYKVVHLPFHGDAGAFHTVNVFTLGDTSWREVPLGLWSTCLLSFGIVTVNGATYWVNGRSNLMAFDLKAERLAFVATLPVRVQVGLPLGLDIYCQLTTDMISGKLGVAVCSRDMKRNTTLRGIKTEVWVLEDRGRNNNNNKWALRLTVVEPGRDEPLHKIAWPHVTHGEHVLTTQKWGQSAVLLRASRLDEGKTHCGVVRLEGTPPSIGMYYGPSIRTFAYVETEEPLPLYACHHGEFGGDVDWKWRFDYRGNQWKLKLNSIYFYVVES